VVFAKLIKLVFQAHEYKALVMIGDGATDLEVSRPHLKLCTCGKFPVETC
jgi:soluble P-type ATPase